MKKIRSLFTYLLAVSLVLCLAFSAIAPVCAAETDMDELYDNLAKAFGITQADRDNYSEAYKNSLPMTYEQSSENYYVALGGDTATGYYGNIEFEQTYPELVAAKYGLELDENFKVDAGGIWTATNAETLIKKKYKTIAKADLITFNLDSAAFISSSMDAVIAGTAVNWEEYITDPDFLAYIKTFRSQMTEEYAAEYGQKNAESIATVLEYMLYECVVYGYETLDTIDAIRVHNETAVLLVLGLYNPLNGLTFTAGGKTIDISGIIDGMIDICNVFLLTKTLDLENTAFIDISDTSTHGYENVNLDKLGSDLESKLYELLRDSDKQYANQNGHYYIRDQILGALKAPCKHPGTTIKNAKEATCAAEGYTGDKVCTECGEIREAGKAIDKKAHSFGNWTLTQAPTCKDKGVETRTCSSCKGTETRPVNTVDHSWNNGVVTTQPSCGVDGIKTFTCTICSATRTEAVAAISHSWDSGAVTKAPGCENEGIKTFTCNNCKATKTENIKATGHSWDNGTVTKAPGCETKGTKTFTCSKCNSTKAENIKATGHSWDNGTITKEPKCETKGTKTFTCKNCNSTKNENVSATGHKLDSGTITLAPGCETSGVKTTSCTKCSYTTTATIVPTGHTWDDGVVTTAPGCETEGVKTTTCTKCSATKTAPVAAAGHNWDNGTITTAPGCETEGVKTTTCTNCSATTTASVAAIGHNWDNGTVTTAPGCETEGVKTITCSNCKSTKTESVAPTDHTWDNGTVTKEPGCETEGVKTITCTSCGATKPETESIPATGHSFGEYKSNGDATCQKDGTKTAVCSACDAKDTVDDTGSRTDHVYEDGACKFCSQKESSGSATVVIIIVSVSVVAVGGGAAGFFIFKKKKLLK